jgi:class 3 adenylate cyclase/pimeloyl-ACP methyl ester carboxylesterase
MTKEVPKTLYAKSGDVNIAYQVDGEGPFDLVHVPPYISNLELQWEDPAQTRYLKRLSSFSRLIMFDKRGTGLSDRVAIATLEERMDDVRAVMDAARSERAAVFGSSEGGALAILFAATYPERVSALVLYGAYPRFSWAPDYPGIHPESFDSRLKYIEETWGRIGGTGLVPNLAKDPAFREALTRFERLSASPGAAVAITRMILQIDVRHLLTSVRLPTLVLYRTGDFTHAHGSRYIGEHIPGAKTVELPGEDYFPWVGDQDAIVDNIEEFLTGVRPVRERDRVLATVLFTDIVGSTERAAKVSDREWLNVLSEHDAIVRKEVDRYRGRLVKMIGDGALATFDGPARGVRCACEIRAATRRLGIEIRCGLHTGEIEISGDDVGGIAVHIAQRVSALAEPGEVLVSRTVTDLVAGSGLEFVNRGERELKGVPGRQQLQAVER